MNGNDYLIDTSASIKYLAEVLPAAGIAFMNDIVDRNCIISFVTEIELQVWNPPDPKDLLIFKELVAKSTIIGLDQKIIDKIIYIRKNFNLRFPDAIISATALINDFTLIADNDKDFLKVPELKYINPMKMM